jgi:hypothetical protein
VRLANRVQKLERTEVLKRHLLPLDQFQRALNDAAVRVTGKSLDSIQEDERAMERVMGDLQESFVRNERRRLGEPYHRSRANRLCRLLTP